MSKKILELSPDLSLPLDIITRRTATYGDSGAGKTAFARLLAEKVHASGQRFCAIDLKNDWWGLKSSADGQSEGLPVVIFGGPRSDVKLMIPDRIKGQTDPANTVAQTLAQTITSIDQSTIIDLDGFSRTKQERFLAPFLDALYENNRLPLLVFCDEADRYAPQKPMSEEAIMSLSSSEDIARRGRKRGIGSFWLTQRTAVLNKNVSEFANLTVIFRTPGEKDLNELEDRVGRISSKEVVKEVMKLAPGLEDGQCVFLSAHPKIRGFLPDPVRPIQLPLPSTFDSSATPEVGQRRREPKVLAQADLAAIEQKMQKEVQTAKENDPKLLRAELQKLRGELQKLQSAKPAPAPAAKTEIKRVEVNVVKAKEAQRVESAIKNAEKIATKTLDALAQCTTAANHLAHAQNELSKSLAAARREGEPLVPVARPAPQRLSPLAPSPVVQRAPAHTPRAPADNADPTDPDKLSSLEQRILDAIAWWNAAGIAYPTKEQTAFVAKAKPYGGHFGNTLGKLRSAGLIDYPQPGALMLTASGAAIAAAPESDPTYEEMIERARSIIRESAQRRIFDVLVEAGVGAEIPKDEVGQRAQFSSGGGHFGNVLGAMRSGGLIDYPRPRFVGLGAAFSAFNGVTA